MPLPQSVAELLAPRAVPLPLQVGAAGLATVHALPTGIPGLDALAAGGVPRGRLTEVAGPRGAGTTTLLRELVARTVADGGWVAVVDASRTLDPRDWAPMGDTGRVWVVRPEDPARGAWCADVLLRTGTFALVVLDAAPPLSSAVAVRLTRLARDSGAALVVAGDGGTRLGGAMRWRVGAWRSALGARHVQAAERRAPSTHRMREDSPRTISLLVEKGGIHETVEVKCGIGLSRRLRAHPEVPDRRGVARRAPGQRGAGGGRAGAAGAGPVGGHVATDDRRPGTEYSSTSADARQRVIGHRSWVVGVDAHRPPPTAHRRAPALG